MTTLLSKFATIDGHQLHQARETKGMDAPEPGIAVSLSSVRHLEDAIETAQDLEMISSSLEPQDRHDAAYQNSSSFRPASKTPPFQAPPILELGRTIDSAIEAGAPSRCGALLVRESGRSTLKTRSTTTHQYHAETGGKPKHSPGARPFRIRDAAEDEHLTPPYRGHEESSHNVRDLDEVAKSGQSDQAIDTQFTEKLDVPEEPKESTPLIAPSPLLANVHDRRYKEMGARVDRNREETFPAILDQPSVSRGTDGSSAPLESSSRVRSTRARDLLSDELVGARPDIELEGGDPTAQDQSNIRTAQRSTDVPSIPNQAHFNHSATPKIASLQRTRIEPAGSRVVDEQKNDLSNSQAQVRAQEEPIKTHTKTRCTLHSSERRLLESIVQSSLLDIAVPATVIQSRSEESQSNKDVPAAITDAQARQAFLGQQTLSRRLEGTTCDSPDHQLGSSDIKDEEGAQYPSPEPFTNVELIMQDVQDVGSSEDVMADSEQKDFASDDARLRKVGQAGSKAHLTSRFGNDRRRAEDATRTQSPPLPDTLVSINNASTTALDLLVLLSGLLGIAAQLLFRRFCSLWLGQPVITGRRIRDVKGIKLSHGQAEKEERGDVHDDESTWSKLTFTLRGCWQSLDSDNIGSPPAVSLSSTALATSSCMTFTPSYQSSLSLQTDIYDYLPSASCRGRDRFGPAVTARDLSLVVITFDSRADPITFPTIVERPHRA